MRHTIIGIRTTIMMMLRQQHYFLTNLSNVSAAM